jgi:pyridoxamine 5'-phosphate oxidase
LCINSRPRESKISAWTSEQSKVIANREALNEKYEILNKKYPDENVPRPPYWGGYVLKPISIEFWQGRPNRLHDRILYTLENNNWKIERLSP